MISNKLSTQIINIITKQCCTRDDTTTWSIRLRGGHYGTISKNGDKYFAHYANRTTTLTGHDNFMQAVADIMSGFIPFMMNLELPIKDMPVLYKAGGFTAIKGSDGRLYVNHISSPFHMAMPTQNIYAFSEELLRTFPDAKPFVNENISFTKNLFIILDEDKPVLYNDNGWIAVQGVDGGLYVNHNSSPAFIAIHSNDVTSFCNEVKTNFPAATYINEFTKNLFKVLDTMPVL